MTLERAVVATASRDSTIYAKMMTPLNALAMRLIAPLREGGRFPLNGLGSGQFLLPMSGVAYAAGRLSANPSLRLSDSRSERSSPTDS